MKNDYQYRGVLCAALVALPLPSLAGDAVFDAISGGKVTGNFRLRYEDVAVDPPTLLDAKPYSQMDASALTLRTRLGYETAPFEGITAFGEFEDTHIIGAYDDYAPAPGSSNVAGTGYTRAAIVDPEQTEINQAYLRYRGVPKLDVTAGRQRITLDNQRFIGNVGWRQNEQTFDALSVGYKGIADWNFYYAYIDRVHGIANVKPTFNFSVNTSDNLVNISYSGFVLGKITAYSYLLKNEEPLDALKNLAPYVNALNPGLRYKANNTVGIRFDGNYALPTTMPLRALYTAEYAKQKLTNPKDVDYETDYQFAEVGMGYVTKIGVLSAKLAYEAMGADATGASAFQTPYATKHAFNGWDDMFLVTPNTGLHRKFATLAGDLQPYGVKAMLSYSQFAKDVGSGDYGTELDAQVVKSFGAKYTLGVKYAAYSADSAVLKIGTNPNMDTRKYWLFAELAF